MIYPVIRIYRLKLSYLCSGVSRAGKWDSGFYYDTYFILSPSADLNLIGERLTQINKAGAGDFLKNAYNEVGLELVRDIHFSKTEPGFDNAVKGDKSFLQILVFTALDILIIGCITLPICLYPPHLSVPGVSASRNLREPEGEP